MAQSTIDMWNSRGEFTNIQNHTVFFLDLGDQSASKENTLVLIHGFPESSFSYRNVVDELLNKFERILLMDFIGFGFSDKPADKFGYSIFEHADFLHNFLQQRGVQGAHLLAHDMGCSVLTEMVHRENHQLIKDFEIQSACITNSGMVISEVSITLGQKLLLSRFGKYFTKVNNKLIFANQVRSAATSVMPKQEIDFLWDILCINNGHKIGHLLARYYFDRKVYWDFRWVQALRDSTKPVYMFWGMKDKVGNPKVATYLGQNINGIKIIKDETLGHFCQLENPERWLKSVSQLYINI